MTDEEYQHEYGAVEERIGRLIERLQELGKPWKLHADPQVLEATRATLKNLEDELDRRDELIHRRRSSSA